MSSLPEPIWLSVGRAFVGIQEQPGPESNPVIIRWARDLNCPLWYSNDDQAWCSVWMNRILMAVQLPVAGTGFALLRAQTFEGYGAPVLDAVLGTVLVFNRPGGYHVGMYVAETADMYRVLGGNQNNGVSLAWLQKERCTAKRWPEGKDSSKYKRVLMSAIGGPVSTSEA